jgi:hypothetical protein
MVHEKVRAVQSVWARDRSRYQRIRGILKSTAVTE